MTRPPVRRSYAGYLSGGTRVGERLEPYGSGVEGRRRRRCQPTNPATTTMTIAMPAAEASDGESPSAGARTYPDRGAHNALAKEVVDLVLGLARESPRWGYLRTVGECPNLSVDVSATATRKLLRRYRLGPAPRTTGPWCSEPLKAQAAATIACDLFYVDTVSLRRLYVLFFIEPDRRMAYLAGVTAHPVGPWPTPQARYLEATFDDQQRPFRFLARDRGTKFVGPFDEVTSSVGARVMKTPFRAPRANAFAERSVLRGPSAWAGHLSALNATPRTSLHEFVTHYNRQRPHRGTNLGAPVPNVAQHRSDSSDVVERVGRLGGLLHENRLAAWLWAGYPRRS